jgi:gliding motility-associated-like protein
LTVSNQTICSTQTITLTANGAMTYSWSTGQNTNTISVSPSSLTVYSVTGTTGLCSDTKTVSVAVVSSPAISVGNATICSGNATTLTANGATTYTWMPGGELTSTISVSPTSTQNYTITGANGTCTASALANVSVTATPSLSVNSVTICPGQTATLTASGATSYTWTPGNVTGSTYTFAPVSNTTVSLVGANSTCTATANASITIGTGISISVNNPTICAGQTVSLIANGASSYTWDTGANTNSISVNPTGTQVYTVSGTSGSCAGINTATVTVVSQPTISVPAASVCSGNSTQLTASGANTYTWMPGGQTTSSVSVNPAATEVYTVTGSNGSCTNSTVVTVNVTSTPTLAVNSVTICNGQTAALTATGATSYSWDSGNVTGSTYTISPPTNTFVTVIGANGTCTAQATPSITIGSAISISVNNPTICAGETAFLTASGAISYTWNSGSITSTLNVTPATTTTYTVTGSNGNCTGSTTATVLVNPAPTFSVNSPSICAGETASLIANGAVSYTWGSGAISNSLNVNPLTSTHYTITGSDGNCTSSQISTVTVNSVPSLTVNSGVICVGQTATLIATGATSYTWSTFETTSTITPAPVNTSTYSVTGSNLNCNSSVTTVTVTVSPSPTLTINASNSGGCTPVCVNFTDVTSASCSSIQYNFGDGTTGNTNNPTHCYTSGGSFTVTATCTTSLGCTSTHTLPGALVINSSPVADFIIAEDNIVTVGSGVNLTNSSNNAISYAWNLCHSTSTATNVTISYADTGSCCIELVALNGMGCSDTISKCIQIVDQAVVVIPNVFTPNGDTKNDLFKIKAIGIKSLSCVIFDRWGLKMHEWDGVNGYWDGAAKSGLAPDGTYFYIINYTDHLDNTTTEKGFLNLFRD